MPLAPVSSIHTLRLSIRPVEEGDLVDLMEVNGDDEVTRFLPYPTWRVPEDGARWLQKARALEETGTGRQLVVERREDHKVIGTVLLFKFDERSRRLEVGYVMGRSSWRQGLGTEALQAVCEHAFGPLSIRRIEAEVNPLNVGSNRLLERLGFVREGLLRQRWVDEGAPYDTYIYGCLADEWFSREGAGARIPHRTGEGGAEGLPRHPGVG